MRNENDQLASASLSLPVVLSDGSERVLLGTLSVCPSAGFRKLQFDISRMTGVPPYHMLAFLERPKTSDRIPIDGRTDLGIVLRDGGEWQILAVLRRPRNGRNRRGRRAKKGFTEERKPQPEKIILRRNDAGNAPVVYDLMHGPVPMMPMWGRFYQPQIFEVPVPTQTDGSYGLCWDTWRASEPAMAVCAVCEAASYLGVDAAFHCCARDEIVEVASYVRPAVGPIERPSVKRVPGCA